MIAQPPASSGQNSVSLCSPASRGFAALRPRSAGLTPLTPAPRTLVKTWPLDDDARSDAPFEIARAVFGAQTGRTDACTVRFALVQSGEVYCRKALPISSLHKLRATLDQHRTQRNRVDIQDEDHVDPPDQSHRVERDEDTRAHKHGAIPRARQIPTTQVHPTRATGADDDGAIS